MKFLILHSSTSFLCQAHSCNLQVLSCKHILSIWYNDQQSVVALVVATSCVNIPVVVTTSSRITVLVQISCIHYIHHHQLHILYTYNIRINRKLVPVSTGSISFLHVSTYTSSSISLILVLAAATSATHSLYPSPPAAPYILYFSRSTVTGSFLK